VIPESDLEVSKGTPTRMLHFGWGTPFQDSTANAALLAVQHRFSNMFEAQRKTSTTAVLQPKVNLVEPFSQAKAKHSSLKCPLRSHD
jgi:hypothetical protein